MGTNGTLDLRLELANQCSAKAGKTISSLRHILTGKTVASSQSGISNLTEHKICFKRWNTLDEEFFCQ